MAAQSQVRPRYFPAYKPPAVVCLEDPSPRIWVQPTNLDTGMLFKKGFEAKRVIEGFDYDLSAPGRLVICYQPIPEVLA